MHDSTSPRLRAVAAVAMTIAVIAAFAWLTHSSVAGAQSATPTATPTATQTAPDAGSNGRHGPCPNEQQGSGGSSSSPQQSAPSQSQSTPNTEL